MWSSRHKFCSIVKENNLYGFQFHPEKSGNTGLKAGINDLEVDYSQLNIASLNDPFVVASKNRLKPFF